MRWQMTGRGCCGLPPHLHKGGAGFSRGGISAHCDKWGRTKGCNVMRLLWWRHLQVWSKSSSWGLGNRSRALPSQLSPRYGACFQPLSRRSWAGAWMLTSTRSSWRGSITWEVSRGSWLPASVLTGCEHLLWCALYGIFTLHQSVGA